MKYQNHANAHEHVKPVEKTGKSITVPNMALTPNEVFKRFASGLSVDTAFSTAYDGEDDNDLDNDWKFKDFSRMDMAELEEFRHEVINRKKELEDQFQEKKREYDTFVAEKRKKKWQEDMARFEERQRQLWKEMQQSKE